MYVEECAYMCNVYSIYKHRVTWKMHFSLFSSLESVLAQIFRTYTTFTIAFLGNYMCHNSEFWWQALNHNDK